MSLNSDAERGSVAAPRLVPSAAGYATWAPRMTVVLQQRGAEGIHLKKMDREAWETLSAKVAAWNDEEFTAALALAMSTTTGSDGSGAASSTSAAVASAGVKESRKLLIATVERSHKAYGVLYAALPDELCLQVAHLPQGWAYGLWNWLQAKYQGTEDDSVDQLFTNWTALRQESDESFDQYRARVARVRTLLELAKEKPSERMFAFTLLQKLRPHFKPAVLALKSGELLKQNPVDWERVTQFLNAHERNEQRLAAEDDSSSHHAAAAMAASSLPKGRSTSSGDGNRGAQARNGHAGGLRRVTDAADKQCYHCNEFGHIRWDCPQRKKQERDGGSSRRGRGSDRGSRHGVAAATRKQHSDSDSVSDEESPMSKPKKGLTYAAIVHRGMTATASVVPSIQEALAAKDWGVDTMASLHVSGNKKLFSGLHLCEAAEVEVANGGIVRASHRGRVVLPIAVADGRSVKVIINNVYYHPSFSANLLSWGTLKADGWQLHSVGSDTHLLTPGGSKVTLSMEDNVSVLRADGQHHERSAAAQRTFALGQLQLAKVDQLVRLHEKLGHMGFDRMVRLLKGGQTLDLGKLHASSREIELARERVQQCKACAAGKATRSSFGHRGVEKGTKGGQVLHMDIHHVKFKRDGQTAVEWNLIMRDALTSATWINSATTKDEVAHLAIAIVKVAEKVFGCKVQMIHCDGGGEFIGQTMQNFCAKEGITMHWPPADTQQLNGVAERGVRQVKDDCRTLMHHASSDFPKRWWQLAARHAVFVWNRTHVSKQTNMTPLEAMTGRKPSAKHWGVFGCDAYFHVPKKQREETFSSRAEPGIYLGHSSTRGCAVVWSLSAKKLIYSRDVRYMPSFRFVEAFTSGDEAVAKVLRNATTAAWDAAGAAADDDDDVHLGSAGDDNSLKYTVERIVAQRLHRGEVQYQVKWAGYNDAENTWEPVQHVAGTKALDDFENRGQQLDAASSQRDARRNSSESAAAISGASDEEEEEEEEDEREVAADTHTQDSSSATSDVAAPPLPRRSPRSHASSISHEADAVHPRVHMVMSALKGMQCGSAPSAMLQRAMTVVSGLATLEDRTPATYREAMASTDAQEWRASMDREMGSCAEQQAWDLIARSSVPRGHPILKPKWVFKIKVDQQGHIEVFKSRITPKGFQQREGVDYFDTFARTGMYKTMRIGLTLAAKWDHELDQLDVPTAFLRADVEEDVYMELPEGYRTGKEHLVCKLRKSLYGLKQAPRNWYLLFSGFLQSELGFKASVSDPCFLHKRSRTGRLVQIFLFVDDIQVSYHADDGQEWGESKAKLAARFSIKDLGPSTWILGMKIVRDRKQRTITLDQELYVTRALERYGMPQCKPATTPEAIRSGREIPAAVPEDGAAASGGDAALSASEKQLFMELTGTLMYAAISTRLDISHAVHTLAGHMQAPTRQHLQDAKRVLRYLAGTKDIGLLFGGKNEGKPCDSRGHGGIVLDVCAYADADWANNTGDRKSISGWVAKLNGDAVSWSSKKQRTVALSTCEAELYAEAAAVQEVLWLRGLLRELGLRCQMGSVVHGDNQSTIAVSKNGVRSDRTKHVDVKYHFITETINRGDVRLQWVPTTEQQADIFTKALAQPAFEYLRRQLMTR
jgi:hypothetical protein